MVKPVQLHKSIEDEHERCLRSRVDIELHRLMDLAMGRHFGTWKGSGLNKPVDEWYWRFKSLKNEVRRNRALRADGQTGDLKPKDTDQNTAVFLRALWLHFLAADPKWEWLRKRLLWWADLNNETPPPEHQKAIPTAPTAKVSLVFPAPQREPTEAPNNQDTARKAGRPTLRREIRHAFRTLRKSGCIDFTKSFSSQVPAIRQQVRTEVSALEGNKGLGYEATRLAVSRVFNRGRALAKQENG